MHLEGSSERTRRLQDIGSVDAHTAGIAESNHLSCTCTLI